MPQNRRNPDVGIERDRQDISSSHCHVDTSPKRRILIVQQSQSACADVRVFLASMGCDCSVAADIRQALAAIEQKQFDAVVLDSHCLSSEEARAILEIAEISRVLAGRLVILTSEDASPAIRKLVERYSLSSVQGDRVPQQLWLLLGSLFYPDALFGRVTHHATLTVDSAHQRIEAGLRVSNPLARHLLYESGSVTIDLMLEPLADSNRIVVAGQVLDSAKPDRRVPNAPVILESWKGPLKMISTNEFGELHVEFIAEPRVSLEIRVSENRWIAVPLPELESKGPSAKENQPEAYKPKFQEAAHGKK